MNEWMDELRIESGIEIERPASVCIICRYDVDVDGVYGWWVYIVCVLYCCTSYHRNIVCDGKAASV